MQSAKFPDPDGIVMPTVLVVTSSVGGWLSHDTVLRCYMLPDEATMLAVMSEPKRVRSIGVKP